MSGRPPHRSGPLKQKNKPHKNGRHKTKGEIIAGCKGRVALKPSRGRNLKEMRKADKKNKQHQLRAARRAEILQKKRRFDGSGLPHLLVVLPLSPRVDLEAVRSVLCQACRDGSGSDPGSEAGSAVTTLVDSAHKCRFSVVFPHTAELYQILDLAKVADSLLLVHKLGEGLDQFHSGLLDCLMSQGLPTTYHLLQNTGSCSGKAYGSARKAALKSVESRFPSCDKLLPIDTEEQAKAMLWAVQMGKHSAVLSRDRHAHLLVEKIAFVEGGDCALSSNSGGEAVTGGGGGVVNGGNDSGTLTLTGYVRSRPLSVNSLLHITGVGTYQMKQIDSCPQPCGDGRRSRNDMDVTEARVLEVADGNKQESLQSEVVPDLMEAEQTWPTEEELAEAEQVAREKKALKKVPKGTSDYQAAWIIAEQEEEEEEEEDGDGDEEEEMEEFPSEWRDEDEGSGSDDDEEEEEEEAPSSTGDKVDAAAARAEDYDADMDVDEEMKQVERLRSEREHNVFPDEVDTPLDVSARVRFQKYRGLKSFRTSPWDPKENLPTDYARIFQFANFKLTKKRVLQQCEEELEGAMPGWYVTVHVANFPKSALATLSAPFVAYSLLPHENKMSVLHFLVRRTAGYSLPIKSKDSLVFHSGVRRFSACPIFSQHTAGDKHKFERYLRSGTCTVASVYGPISYPPQPLLLFQHQQLQGGGVRAVLVATGSLLSVSPGRVVCKRVVLSGHPYKIHRTSAVIRYMFFNREDISWFKPVELRTKHGRRGHIKEPLGTHGHMKCVFDGQLKAQDTVLLNLYKRVFPKWTFEDNSEQALFRDGDDWADENGVEGDTPMEEEESCRISRVHFDSKLNNMES